MIFVLRNGYELALAGEVQKNLVVTVELMAEAATRLYGHNVDGFLGADYFASKLLSLDFPKRLFSIDSRATLTGSQILEIEVVAFSGLLLVPVTLPNNLTMLAIIDTVHMILLNLFFMKMHCMVLISELQACPHLVTRRGTVSRFHLELSARYESAS